jgi:outer membrane protein OmpA-like peptidoglycan-associated protein
MTRPLLASLLLVGCTAAPLARAPEPEPPPPPSALRDFDGDGFMDPQDRCPREAGVGPLGCPADGDGDGVVDGKDACPKDAGTAANGCPDGDGDGIADAGDSCPDRAETVNGYEDRDGCPDALPKDLLKATGIMRGVQFEPDKDVLKRSALPVLDRAIKALKKYPEVRIEISGHTDSTGDPSNGGMSRPRAEAVKKYLVERGIEEARLEVRGAGSDEPIDTNKTASGRARNRRIEFTILLQ